MASCPAIDAYVAAFAFGGGASNRPSTVRAFASSADDFKFRVQHAGVMSTDEEREELVGLATYLMSGEGTEEEQDAALTKVKAGVPHPRVAALIFWPRHEGFERELRPDEVVDVAMAYRPIELDLPRVARTVGS